MAEPIYFGGQRAWLKRYGVGSRRAALAALRFVADRLHLPALRPPPHRAGGAALEVEARRLSELEAQQVNVPKVIGQARDTLVLSDTGDSLNARLRQVRNDPALLDAMVSAALAAIADGHRKGAYFGQPVPRNMTWAEGKVGFLDFEEDPLEVMSLQQAQARDWLMFGYGVAGFYDDRPDALAALMREAMRGEEDEVRRQAGETTARLGRVARLSLRLGRSARALAHAVFVVHSASTLPLLIVAAITCDCLLDGELDLLKPFI
jgi:tRNA A-37 threonylcarbamoyl transferase component Bud32